MIFDITRADTRLNWIKIRNQIQNSKQKVSNLFINWNFLSFILMKKFKFQNYRKLQTSATPISAFPLGSERGGIRTQNKLISRSVRCSAFGVRPSAHGKAKVLVLLTELGAPVALSTWRQFKELY